MAPWPGTPRRTPVERLLCLLPQVNGSPESLMHLVLELLDLLCKVLSRPVSSRRIDRDCRASHLVLGTSFAVGDVVYVAVH